MGNVRSKIQAGDGFVVPAGTCHNVTNTGKKRLRLMSVFSPPIHEAHLLEGTKGQVQAVVEKTELDLANKEMTNEGGPAPSMAVTK